MRRLEPLHQWLVLSLFFAGVLISLVGTVAATLWRRADISIGALIWAGHNLAAYPERYVRPERVRVVRTIYIVGVLLSVMAVGLLLLAGFGIV
jgi:hypothetical protein